MTINDGSAAVKADFALKTYSPTLNATSGGSVNPSTVTTAIHGVPVAITAPPLSGGDATIQANFTSKVPTISLQASLAIGGNVDPSSVQTLPHGQSMDITANFNAFPDLPSSLLTVDGITSAAFTLHWTAATDVETRQSGLSYKGAISSADNVTSVAEAETSVGGDAPSRWTGPPARPAA